MNELATWMSGCKGFDSTCVTKNGFNRKDWLQVTTLMAGQLHDLGVFHKLQDGITVFKWCMVNGVNIVSDC